MTACTIRHGNWRPPRARFAAKTRRTNSGCLLWVGSTDRAGYGMFRLDGSTHRAHRAAWYIHHGVWPTDCLLHTCDTPACVNVEHLWEGTVADNNADRAAKGRSAPCGGADNPAAVLTEQRVSEIRRRLAGAGRGMGRQLAWEYGVSPSTITNIKLGHQWRTTS